MMKKIEELLDDAYINGHDDGYDEGYSQGYLFAQEEAKEKHGTS
jgi:flagellar biosynthesis/type III secretory pathway protein FliH